MAAELGMRGTTVLCVRKGGKVIIIADGQVTMGAQIVKPNVRKVRKLGEDGAVIAGFAGPPHRDLKRLTATWLSRVRTRVWG